MPVHVHRLQEVKQVRLIAWMLLGILIGPASAAPSWVYQSGVPATDAIEISKEPGRVAIGDRGYEARFCSATGFSCFRSEVLSFAVPASVENVKSWRDGSLLYKVIGSRQLEFMGKQTRVLLIRMSPASPKDHAPVFWYSPAHGLVAIAETEGRGTHLLRVQGRCGFPQAQCR